MGLAPRATGDLAAPAATPLTPHQFADRFEEVGRGLWCIAAAILCDRVQADDVLQESAIIALRKLDQFEPGTSFTAWMGRIVRLTALNHARRRSRQRRMEGSDVNPGLVAMPARPGTACPVDGSGQLVPSAESFDDTLLAALRSLDETARACLLLRTVMDLPYTDISRALDLPPGTAMSHVHRARKVLRDRLSDAPGERDGHREQTPHA